MPVDSDPIMMPGKAPDDFTSMIMDIVGAIQYKFLGLMFVMFIFISSDVFINRGLTVFKGAVDFKYPTNWGVVLQGLFLIIAMMIIDALIRQKII